MKRTCTAVVREVGGAAVIELAGEVDGGAAGPLNAAYEQAVTDGPATTLVLDFAAVDYINSTGIALIVSVLARARSERRSVVASGLSADSSAQYCSSDSLSHSVLGQSSSSSCL